MATINRDNVQYYVDSGLINPSKIKIDLNKTKTAGDNVHRWVTLADAIKSGYDFNFDYDVKEIKTPKVTTLPDLVVNSSSQPTLETKPNYALKNFEDTFGVSARDAASFVPYVGDALDINDILNNVIGGKYKEAAIGAGMFLVPNIVEKPVKSLIKIGKRLKRHLKGTTVDITGYLKYGNAHSLDVKGQSLTPEIKAKQQSSIDRNFDKVYSDQLSNVLDKYNIVKTSDGFLYNGKLLSAEESQLLEKAPVYWDWATSHKVDPTSKDAVTLFIKKQGTGVRGVAAKDIDTGKQYLTTPNSKVLVIDGDRFQSKHGLYTSNNAAIGKHYSENNRGHSSFTGNVFYNYQIDPNLSVLEQLEDLSKKDVLIDIISPIKFKKTYLMPRGYRFKDTGVNSFSQNYRTYSGKTLDASERVFLEPLQLSDISYHGSNAAQKQGDWYKYGIDEQEPYFSRFLVNTPSVRDHYVQVGKQVIDKIPTDASTTMFKTYQNRANQLSNKYKKFNRNMYLTAGGLGLVGGGVGMYLTHDFKDQSPEINSQKDIDIYDQSNWNNFK